MNKYNETVIYIFVTGPGRVRTKSVCSFNTLRNCSALVCNKWHLVNNGACGDHLQYAVWPRCPTPLPDEAPRHSRKCLYLYLKNPVIFEVGVRCPICGGRRQLIYSGKEATRIMHAAQGTIYACPLLSSLFLCQRNVCRIPPCKYESTFILD